MAVQLLVQKPRESFYLAEIERFSRLGNGPGNHSNRYVSRWQFNVFLSTRPRLSLGRRVLTVLQKFKDVLCASATVPRIGDGRGRAQEGSRLVTPRRHRLPPHRRPLPMYTASTPRNPASYAPNSPLIGCHTLAAPPLPPSPPTRSDRLRHPPPSPGCRCRGWAGCLCGRVVGGTRGERVCANSGPLSTLALVLPAGAMGAGVSIVVSAPRSPCRRPDTAPALPPRWWWVSGCAVAEVSRALLVHVAPRGASLCHRAGGRRGRSRAAATPSSPRRGTPPRAPAPPVFAGERSVGERVCAKTQRPSPSSLSVSLRWWGGGGGVPRCSSALSCHALATPALPPRWWWVGSVGGKGRASIGSHALHAVGCAAMLCRREESPERCSSRLSFTKTRYATPRAPASRRLR